MATNEKEDKEKLPANHVKLREDENKAAQKTLFARWLDGAAESDVRGE
jgi:hypothetical protein